MDRKPRAKPSEVTKGNSSHMFRLIVCFVFFSTTVFTLHMTGDPARLISTLDAAERRSSLAVFNGAWRGSGTLFLNGGHQEYVRCTSRVKVAGRGRRASQTIRCINPRYQVYLVSSVNNRGGKISGDWRDKRSGNAGVLSGNFNGKRLDLTMSGTGITASLHIHINKCHQSMNIRSYSGDIEKVQVELFKKC